MLNTCGLFPHQSALQSSRCQQHALQFSSVLTLSTQTPQVRHSDPQDCPQCRCQPQVVGPHFAYLLSSLTANQGPCTPSWAQWFGMTTHSTQGNTLLTSPCFWWRRWWRTQVDGCRTGAQTNLSLGEGLGAPVPPPPGPPPSLDLHMLLNIEALWIPVNREFQEILVLQAWLIVNSVPIFFFFHRWWGAWACWLKKKGGGIMWEFQVKFYLGQNEDYSPGDSTSDSAEKLFQRGRKRTVYMWFWWRGGACNQAHIFP